MMSAVVAAAAALLLFVGVEGGVPPTKNRGLASIEGFCAGDEALDDLRDLTNDAYRKKTGRYGSVSVLNRWFNGRIINPPTPAK